MSKAITIALSGLLLSGLIFTGCQTRAGSGALAGAGLGATAGAIISGCGDGALIGGALGAISGAMIGDALDEQERQMICQRNPQTLRRIDCCQQLSLCDIKAMSCAGVRDDVILSQIYATRSVFFLTTCDIIDLSNAGVSQRVINNMIRTTTCCYCR